VKTHPPAGTWPGFVAFYVVFREIKVRAGGQKYCAQGQKDNDSRTIHPFVIKKSHFIHKIPEIQTVPLLYPSDHWNSQVKTSDSVAFGTDAVRKGFRFQSQGLSGSRVSVAVAVAGTVAVGRGHIEIHGQRRGSLIALNFACYAGALFVDS